jgi:hypothetical protein
VGFRLKKTPGRLARRARVVVVGLLGLFLEEVTRVAPARQNLNLGKQLQLLICVP